MSEILKIKVTPTKQLFYDDNNCFGIYGAKVNEEDLSKVELNEYDNISIRGNIQRLSLGEEYNIYVHKYEKGKYKSTYAIDGIVSDEANIPIEKQPNFLKAVLTDSQFDNIYNVYSKDDDIVSMIKDNTFDYKKIKGLGDKNYINIQKKVLGRLDEGNLLIFLQSHDINYTLIKPLLKEYSNNKEMIMQKIKENPYTLTSVNGIGFKKADEIALSMDYDKESPNRITSCISYVIEEDNKNGHSWVNKRQILNRCLGYLEINKEIIKDILESDDIENVICVDGKYTKTKIYEAEKYISDEIIRMTKQKSKYNFDVNGFLDKYSSNYNVQLTDEQRGFFHMFHDNNISLLIGSGGSGKSFLQKTLVDMCDEMGLSVALLCPTGKASKRLGEYTNRESSTIHRRVISHDSDDGVKEIYDDVIIIDETSMCDIFITRLLFRSIVNNNAKIVFIGDSYQLPSVGVGNILHDMINSGKIPCTRLTKVFRQSEGGMYDIITMTRKGEKFLTSKSKGRKQFGKDCVFMLIEQDKIKNELIRNYENVTKTFSVDDIMIATPTNKGVLGTTALNREIQKIANPPSESKKEKTFGNKTQITFRVGDLVMNQQNRYRENTVDGKEINIFNGEVGKIIDIEKDCVIIKFDVGTIGISFSEILTSVRHSWVCTIHKLQGSQSKVVIVIADKSSTYQLNANLLYTGLSRAEKFLLVLTQPSVFNNSLNTFENMDRRSFLRELLMNA